MCVFLHEQFDLSTIHFQPWCGIDWKINVNYFQLSKLFQNNTTSKLLLPMKWTFTKLLINLIEIVYLFSAWKQIQLIGHREMVFCKYCANAKITMKHMDGRFDGTIKIQNTLEPWMWYWKLERNLAFVDWNILKSEWFDRILFWFFIILFPFQ